MSDVVDKMAKAQEESYFDKKNREALERLKKKKEEEKPRLSPISGEPLVQEVLHGVVIDKCAQSGGIWLDAGELEELVSAMAEAQKENGEGWLGSFFGGLTNK